MVETDLIRRRREDPRSTDELIRIALTEEDEDAAWDPVKVLHYRGSLEVLEKARLLCVSSDARERQLGADVLGQLGVPERTFPEDCFQILAGMLKSESHPEVLQSTAVAFGHLHDVRAVPLLALLKDHRNEDVRYSVVKGLLRHREELAIRTLIALSSDTDVDVRNWATFGLGSMIETDTAEIREALWSRITESDHEIRGEALVGLARRKDIRVLDPLIYEVTSDNVSLLALEAAEEFGDPRLGPALLQLKMDWDADEEEAVLTRQLHEALLSCLPHGNS
jgi:HEAT repeat protein